LTGQGVPDLGEGLTASITTLPLATNPLNTCNIAGNLLPGLSGIGGGEAPSDRGQLSTQLGRPLHPELEREVEQETGEPPHIVGADLQKAAVLTVG
jgi:hypothetical protein